MKNLTFYFAVFFVIISCKTSYNKYITIENKKYRTGKWKEEDVYQDKTFTSNGRYKRNNRIGKWKTYENKILTQKEIYKDSIALNTFYYPNGKRKKTGVTKLFINQDYFHWYYDGKWIFYNNKGQITHFKIYKQGKLLDSIAVTKK
jgi:hypothetical protein